MINYRLINCDFLNASTFLKLSNKAKLLYYSFITNTDDLGFIGNCDTIVEILYKCDDEYEQAKMLGLEEKLKDDYLKAKIELINKCYVYLFYDKLGNEIFVVKHHFLHNKWKPGLKTNYNSIFKQLTLYGGEYYLKEEKPYKEKEDNKKEIENKVNESNVCIDKVEKQEPKDWKNLMGELEALDTREEDDDEE